MKDQQGFDRSPCVEDLVTITTPIPVLRAKRAMGWKHLTRSAYADAIRAAGGSNEKAANLTQSEVLVPMCIAYLPPSSCPSPARKFRVI